MLEKNATLSPRRPFHLRAPDKMAASDGAIDPQQSRERIKTRVTHGDLDQHIERGEPRSRAHCGHIELAAESPRESHLAVLERKLAGDVPDAVAHEDGLVSAGGGRRRRKANSSCREPGVDCTSCRAHHRTSLLRPPAPGCRALCWPRSVGAPQRRPRAAGLDRARV